MPRNQQPQFPDDELARRAKDGLSWLQDHPTAVLGIVVFLLAFFLVPTMIFQVDRNEEAIVLRFGAFAREVQPGLQYKLPFPIERAYIINTKNVFSEEFGYRSEQSSQYQEKDQAHRESLMLTGDLGVARVEWQVQYRKTQPKNFLFNVKNERRVIRETTMAAMRRVVGDKNVTDVITVARKEIRREVKKVLQEDLDRYQSGIQIEDVELQATEPPEPVYPAFKEVDSARQDRERLRNEAERKRETIINEAEGTKNQRISEAEGKAQAIINRAKGEARQFNKMIKQYEAAPEITKTRMFLETMQKVMKESNRVYIVDQKLKGLLPHLQLNNVDTSK